MRGDFLVLLGFVLGAVEMLLVLRFYIRVFGRPRIAVWKLALLAVAWISVVTLAADRVLASIHPRSMPVMTVAASCALLPFFRGRRKQMLLFAVLLTTLAFAWTMMIDALTTPNPALTSWLIYPAVHAGFWLLLEPCGLLGRGGDRDIPRSMWALLCAIALGSLAVMTAVTVNMSRPLDAYLYGVPYVSAVVLAAFLLVNLALFYLFDRFADLMEQVKERGLLEQQLLLQSDHYRQMEQYGERLRALHHDMRNHLETAGHMLARGDGCQALADYLGGVSHRLREIEETVATGNPEIDSVLNLKLGQLRGEGVRVESALHIPPGLCLGFQQAVVIFGNLLDNAREACAKLPRDRRRVRLELRYDGGALFVLVENTADGQPAPGRDGLPATSKANPRLHGLGLKNVRGLVEGMGTMAIDWEDGVFRVRIVLYDIAPRP